MAAPEHLPALVGEFGPFNGLQQLAHALYADGRCDEALTACAEALLLVERAGDDRTVRYLRYIACLAHERTGQWSQMRQRSEELLGRLGTGAGPFWRAKVLGLQAHALVQQGRPGPALDALAEAYGLIVENPGSSYNRGSACQAVSGPLSSVLLFEPAVQLLRTAQEVLGYRGGGAFPALEEATTLGNWGLFLELLGRDAEADSRYIASASAAVRAQALARRMGNELLELQARSLLQFAYQRLRCEPADLQVLRLHASLNVGPDALLPRLAIASAQARTRDLGVARELTAQVKAEAERLGEVVPAWTAAAWLAELEEHEHGGTEATRRWRDLAVSSLERLWWDRAGRFEHLVGRRRVARLSELVRDDSNRLWEDALTGVGNRRLLDELMAGPESTNRPVAFIDVDHFKLVNDDFGHDVGDEVLRRIAVALRTVCRAGDTVIRYGGDEFVVVLSEDGDAEVLARRIREVVARFSWDDVASGLHVTVSVGISTGGPGALGRADADLLGVKARRAAARTGGAGGPGAAVERPGDGRQSAGGPLPR
ncbi:MAG TPA: GGDEF domain-containing protein [Kineosporiaceae bacterium]|nr:GGDEF domain-containing protein [Kineosporiaceae bacterium]